MAIKVDVSALKKRLEKQKEEAEQRKQNRFDPANSLILKVKDEGKINVRAVPYPHSENPEVDPFPKKAYHYGIPGNKIFYCPQENDGESCVVCDFVWKQMGENKGNKEVVKSWASFLPKFNYFLPVLVRGREEEGPKFFKINTYKDKPSDREQSIWEFFYEEDTADWVDPDKGFDLILDFEKSPMFGLTLKKGPLVLARKSTPFGKKGEYEAFIKQIPDLNTVKGYESRTSREAEEVLVEWAKKLGENVTPSVEGELDSGNDENSTNTPEAVSGDSIHDKLKTLGI